MSITQFHDQSCADQYKAKAYAAASMTSPLALTTIPRLEGFAGVKEG
jgi:hypothetical protein